MARGSDTRSAEAKFYLAEHLAARGDAPKDLAAMLDVTEATVSRWLSSDPTKKRRPHFRTIHQIERGWGLSEGALFRPPARLPKQELLTGISEAGQRTILDYIGYVRQLERERSGGR